MNLYGERVLLRAIEPGDNDMLMAMVNDPEIEHMLGGWSFPVSGERQLDWYRQLPDDLSTLRCVIENEQSEGIGVVMLTDIDYKNGNAQIHIKLGSDTGRGYGTEAVRTIVGYAFGELRLKCVYARVNSYNLPSQRMFEKCGFEKEGTLRARIYKRGAYHDEYIYSILSGGPS